jgi:CHRD domain
MDEIIPNNTKPREEEYSMKKSLVRLFIYALLFMFVSLGVAAAAENYGGDYNYNSGGDPTFKAKLTGGEEVPPVTTKARGEAVFTLGKTGELTYTLRVKDLENAVAAHMHTGKKGEGGPPVAALFSGPMKAGKFSGVLAKGSFTDKDLIGPLAGKSIKDLVDMIKAGNVYVNVHTEKYGDGEIRGQVK